MKILWFEGSSDDTFGMTRNGDDTTSCDDYDDGGSGTLIEWRVWSPGEELGLIVSGQYERQHTVGWSIGIGQVANDNKPFPPWTIRVEPGDRVYSPRLVLEVPDDVEIDCLQRVEGEG